MPDERVPAPREGRPPSLSGDAPGAAETGDAIAAEILSALAPMQFREAASEPERMECLRLRYRAVVEMRMAAAADFPNGLESDDFDASAIHILGLDDGRSIATSRIVLPLPGRSLPTEAAYGLRLPGAGVVVEFGRVVVDPGYRGDGHSVFMGLAARGWLSMRARGYTTAIGATPRRLIALFEALGITVTVLGEPRSYWGEERYPILCDSRPAIERLEREWLAGEGGPPPAPDEPKDQ
jgi:N-acyl-L-homoserine lactone synthetase